MNDGKHYGGYQYRNKRNNKPTTKKSILGTVITLVAGSVIKDLTSENSKLLKLTNKLFRPIKIEDNKNKIIDVKYKMVDDHSK